MKLFTNVFLLNSSADLNYLAEPGKQSEMVLWWEWIAEKNSLETHEPFDLPSLNTTHLRICSFWKFLRWLDRLLSQLHSLRLLKNLLTSRWHVGVLIVCEYVWNTMLEIIFSHCFFSFSVQVSALCVSTLIRTLIHTKPQF